MERIAIIGVGRVGGAFALALDRCGYRVAELITRDGSIPSVISFLSRPALVTGIDSKEAISAEIVIVATPDPDIEEAVTAVAHRLAKNSVVFHTSGSLSSGILSALANCGHETGSVHPLVAVSDPISGAEALLSAFFCIEGTQTGVTVAQEIVTRLGGQKIVVETAKKPLYHAAAVMSAGHLVALLATAHRLIAMAGIDPEQGSKALLLLSRSALANLFDRSPEESLTGPFARLDIAAFRRHLDLMETHADDLSKEVYLSLAAVSLQMVQATGENASLRDQFVEELNMAKAKFK